VSTASAPLRARVCNLLGVPLADVLFSFPFFLIVVGLQSPGQIVSDTKYDLLVDPAGFLGRSLHVWTDQSFSGQVQNQAYGYLFPHGAFFALGQLAHVPPWLTERLWWAIALTVGFSGLYRLARALGIATGPWRVLAALAYVGAPKVLTSLTSISSEIWPMMFAPWVLLAVHAGLTGRWTPRRAGAAGALALALMGAVNAVATVAACLPALIWLLTCRPNRTWRRVAAWWIGLSALVSLWWIVPLFVLGGVAPPFLDYIESSAVTSRWAALVEVVRGTSAWVPYVSPAVPANAPLVSSPLVIVATAVVAGAGLAGLAWPAAKARADGRDRAPAPAIPHRDRLALMLGVGLLAMTAAYMGTWDSHLAPHFPLASAVRDFLDGAAAPLRNLHKWEPVGRIPIVLGLAYALGRAASAVRGRASAGDRDGASGERGAAPGLVRRLEHVEAYPGLAAALAVVLALALAVVPVWKGELADNGPHDAPASYWDEAAGWLAENASDSRTLVAPGTSFGVQVWGTSRDETLQPLAKSPWAVRDSIPLQPAPAIRALDSVQRVFDSGRPAPGLSATLEQQGIGYVVVRADLVPDQSRTRPALVHEALRSSGGFTPVASFGEPLGSEPVVGAEATATVDSGFRPEVPPIVIYRVGPGTDAAQQPYTVPLDQVPQVAGGPESLARLDDVAALRAQGPVDPTARLLAGDAAGAGIAPTAVIGTDSPTNRETDFGRATQSTSELRTPGQERETLSPLPDYAAQVGDPDQDSEGNAAAGARGRTSASWSGGSIGVSSSAGDANQPGPVQIGLGVAALADRDERTSWRSRTGYGAFGQSVRIDIAQPRDRLLLRMLTPPAEEQKGSPVVRVEVRTDNGTALQSITPGTAASVALPAGPTTFIEIRAAATESGTRGTAFEVSELGLTSAGQDVLPRRGVDVPRADGQVLGWSLGTDYPGRSACLPEAGRIAGPGNRPGAERATPCDSSLEMAAEEPGTFSRTLDLAAAEKLRPVLTMRARPGAELDSLLTAGRAERTASGASDVDDPMGNALAAVDGDPLTAWRAPTDTIPERDRVVAGETTSSGSGDGKDGADADAETPTPELKVSLPRRGAVGAVRVTPAPAVDGAEPEKIEVAVGDRTTEFDLADVPAESDGSWVLDLPRATNDEVTLRITEWSNVRNDAGEGFVPRPVALGEVDVLGARGESLAPALGSSGDLVEVPCSAGPEVKVVDDGGQTVSSTRMTLRASVDDLRRGTPVLAAPCGTTADTALDLPAGHTTVEVDPGPALSVDGIELSPPGLAGRTLGAVEQKRVSTSVEQWSPARRELSLDSPTGDTGSLLVVPQSYNTGWTARLVTADGSTPLSAVPVGGWQQGFVLPAGAPAGARVVLTFPLDTPYRAALATGPFALVFVLWMLFARGHDRAGAAAEPIRGTRRRWAIGGAVAGLFLGGIPGLAMFGAAILWLRRLPPRAAPLLSAGALAVGAALVGRQPWPGTVWGGDSITAQLFGLAALSVVFARATLDSSAERSARAAERADQKRRAGSSTQE